MRGKVIHCPCNRVFLMVGAYARVWGKTSQQAHSALPGWIQPAMCTTYVELPLWVLKVCDPVLLSWNLSPETSQSQTLGHTLPKFISGF